MKLSDSEIAMLEQLTYLNKDVVKAATGKEKEFDIKKNETVGEVLSIFGEDELKSLEEKENIDFVSGKEWSEIIRYLKTSRLKNMKIVDIMKNPNDNKKNLALCFSENKKSNNVIVAFKGTTGSQEWDDNFQGMNKEDTKNQREALDYIESLPYDNVTVTGHSKGANKAMYVTINSNKINRCVTFDGQGFSKEFINKYTAEIQKNGGKITAYSLSSDYVHPLLFQIPNAKQIYCKGYGIGKLIDKDSKNDYKIDMNFLGEYHCLNSLFKTKNGKIVTDKSGKPIIVEDTDEEPLIKILHKLSNFIANNANDKEKENLILFLSAVTRTATTSGKDQSTARKELFKNRDKVGLFLAYVSKALTYEEIEILLKKTNITYLDKMFVVKTKNAELNGVSDFINFLKKMDKADKSITRNIYNPLFKMLHLPGTFFLRVKSIETSGGFGNVEIKASVTRDFSSNMYDLLINTVNNVEKAGNISVSSWSGYSNEKWFNSLCVASAVNGINTYFTKLSETNQLSKVRIAKVFDEVREVDANSSKKLSKHYQDLKKINNEILDIANNLKI